MNILKAEKDDLKTILQLQYLAYQNEAELFKNKDIPPLKQTIDDLMNEFDNGIILKMINDNDEIIGSIRAFEDNDTIYIGKLMVHPDFRLNGYGTRLLLEIEKYYPHKRYELFTSTKSIDNINLYQSLGYQVFDNKVINDELEFVYMEKDNKRIMKK